jgi:hypothetical protein
MFFEKILFLRQIFQVSITGKDAVSVLHAL